MRTNSQATFHTCDGCSTTYIQIDDEQPNGFYVQIYEVHDGGSVAGDLYVCAEGCLLEAFTRREDIWNPDKETP